MEDFSLPFLTLKPFLSTHKTSSLKFEIFIKIKVGDDNAPTLIETQHIYKLSNYYFPSDYLLIESDIHKIKSFGE
jgi:hypothetical protein